jgi:hypothetical protein
LAHHQTSLHQLHELLPRRLDRACLAHLLPQEAVNLLSHGDRRVDVRI